MKKFLIVSIALMTSIITGCSENSSKINIEEITSQINEVKSQIDSGDDTLDIGDYDNKYGVALNIYETALDNLNSIEIDDDIDISYSSEVKDLEEELNLRIAKTSIISEFLKMENEDIEISNTFGTPVTEKIIKAQVELGEEFYNMGYERMAYKAYVSAISNSRNLVLNGSSYEEKFNTLVSAQPDTDESSSALQSLKNELQDDLREELIEDIIDNYFTPALRNVEIDIAAAHNIITKYSYDTQTIIDNLDMYETAFNTLENIELIETIFVDSKALENFKDDLEETRKNISYYVDEDLENTFQSGGVYWSYTLLIPESIWDLIN